MTGTGQLVYATHTAATAETLAPFTAAVDRLLVAGRYAKDEAANVGLLTTNGVDYLPLMDYSSLRGMLFALPKNAVLLLAGIRGSNVVYLRIPEPLSIMAGILAIALGKPIISSVVADPTTLVTGRQNLVQKLMAGILTHSSRLIVRRSRAATYVTRETLQRSVPPGEIPTLVRSNVHHIELRAKPPSNWRSTAALKVVHVGNHQTLGKGQDVLLQAGRILNDRGVQVRVIFVGGGRWQQWLEWEAHRLGVDAVFAGHVAEREELNKILDGSDIFVLPSLSEGMPRALIEAMARGLPCVATSVGGMGELLGAEYLVRPGDPAGLAAAMENVCASQRKFEQAVNENQKTAIEVSRLAGPERLTNFLVSNGPGGIRG